MYRFSILLILSALFCCGWNTNSLYAQERISWDDFIERYLADEEYTDEAREQLYQSLTELHDHPQNLNRATKEELDRMPFLNDEAVEEILAYIYRFGPMKSMGELDLIPKLDYTIR